MKIPRDLYYRLNQQSFLNAPWCRERSVREGLEHLVEENLSLEPNPDPFISNAPVASNSRGNSKLCFGTPPCVSVGRGDVERSESIEFKPFALHAGDEQPLQIYEARRRHKQGEDLEFMHVPVADLSIPFGENFHTVTDRNFESMVGKVRKPFGLTWKKWDRTGVVFETLPPGIQVFATTARKVDFLQKCMVALRIIDSGSMSEKEAVQAFSRLLNDRRFYSDDTDEEFYWLNWDPMAYVHDLPGPQERTTRTFMQIPINGSSTEDDYQTVQLRAIAAHEGDQKPIPVAKEKVLNNEDTDLMQVPLGHIGWIPMEKRQGVFEQSVSWTWTEDWKEPSEWTWADGWEDPIELTWRKATGYEGGIRKSAIQKIVFLRHYLKMIYIVNTGEGIEEDEVVRAIEELAGIELRHSTNSLGQDYWWKVQHDGSSIKSSSRSSGFSNPPSRPGKDRSDPRVPSQTVVDLYGGDEEQAHAHWCNTH